MSAALIGIALVALAAGLIGYAAGFVAGARRTALWAYRKRRDPHRYGRAALWPEQPWNHR